MLGVLDTMRLIPHPVMYSDESGIDDCHWNATSGVIEALLQARISNTKAELEQYADKKVEAIEKEDYLHARDVKVDERKVQEIVQESEVALNMYKNVTDMYRDLFCVPSSISSPFQPGLASWEVREWYTQHVDDMADRMQACKLMRDTAVATHKTPCVLAALALRMRLPAWAVHEWYTQRLEVVVHRMHAYKIMTNMSPDLEAYICSLAALAVRMRSKVKVDARLRGSAALHVACFLRDWAYYGLFPDTMQRKRTSMVQKGLNPTYADICNAVIDSSFRTNEEVNAVGKDLKIAGMSYFAETASIYLFIGFMIWCATCLYKLLLLGIA